MGLKHAETGAGTLSVMWSFRPWEYCGGEGKHCAELEGFPSDPLLFWELKRRWWVFHWGGGEGKLGRNKNGMLD